VNISDFYRPFPRQAQFHESGAKYRLFGGAAGPGKSFALIWEAILHCLQYPGSSSLLLRRTTPMLKESLLNHFVKFVPPEVYGGRLNYNSTDHIVKFPNGSTLRFGHIQHDSDKMNYHGGEYLFIGFDELTEFTFTMWDFLTSRNRCPIPGAVPCMAGATNPGGIGHAWVKALWVDRKACEEMEPESYDAVDYEFIAARVTDNPVYANDATYMSTLQKLSAPLRAAMLHGSWDVVAGQYFDTFERGRNVISRSDTWRLIKPWTRRWLSLDWGYTHHFYASWHAAVEDRAVKKVLTYREFLGNKMSERAVGEEIIARSTTTEDRNGKLVQLLEPLDKIFLSPEQFGPRYYQKMSTADALSGIFQDAGLPRCSPADDDRLNGWRYIHRAFEYGEAIISEDCPQLIAAIPLLMRSSANSEDVQKTETKQDDIGDGYRYGLKSMRLNVAETPAEAQLEAKLSTISDPTHKMLTALAFNNQQTQKRHGFRLPRRHM
jgi:phage terminase large subunit